MSIAENAPVGEVPPRLDQTEKYNDRLTPRQRSQMRMEPGMGFDSPNQPELSYSKSRGEYQRYTRALRDSIEKQRKELGKLEAFNDLLESIPEEKRSEHASLIAEITEKYLGHPIAQGITPETDEDAMDSSRDALGASYQNNKGLQREYQEEALTEIRAERGQDATSFGQSNEDIAA